MTTTPKRTKSDQQRDPDLINAEIALKRAANKARELARKAGTPIVIFEDGKIIEKDVTTDVHSRRCRLLDPR